MHVIVLTVIWCSLTEEDFDYITPMLKKCTALKPIG